VRVLVRVRGTKKGRARIHILASDGRPLCGAPISREYWEEQERNPDDWRDECWHCHKARQKEQNPTPAPAQPQSKKEKRVAELWEVWTGAPLPSNVEKADTS
jgi:hypothetical protein